MDKSKILYIGIDDFALKKRQRYGTVMVNTETRQIVDMIESREAADVSRWLSGYPNLQVVSRDGALSYAAAIAEAHPTAMQVSDRFHILKNLVDYAKQALQKLFQGRIAIPATDKIRQLRYDILIGTTAQKAAIVKRLQSENRSKKEITALTGLSIRMISKYTNIEGWDALDDKQTVREREHDEAILKLTKRAEPVQSLHESGLILIPFSHIP